MISSPVSLSSGTSGTVCLGDVPDVAIANGGHLADLLVFQREGFRVVRSAAAVDVPAVEHAIVVGVNPRLVVDRGPQLVRTRRCRPGRGSLPVEERGIQQLRDQQIARLVQVAAVDRELGAGSSAKTRQRGREKIDEGQASLGGQLRDRRRCRVPGWRSPVSPVGCRRLPVGSNAIGETSTNCGAFPLRESRSPDSSRYARSAA